MIVGLVLAAGAGRRYGGLKQLAPLGGRPILERVLAAMAASPVDGTVVVLGAQAEAVLAGVDLHGALPVRCEEWEDGVSMSLRAGLEAIPDAEAAVVTVGDQPLLSPLAVERVLAARDPASRGAGGSALAVRATYAGVPGHPVVIENALFERARSLSGDAGARALLDSVPTLSVPCDGLGRPEDVDTPQELYRLGDELVAQ